ncbi:cell wall assembly protein [Paenibacillus ihbetae]|uniref:Cell wall assembly protein n=1 Tax=Paenibacillus ihbetae TaxID=1870820 RepID=A0A1B2E1H8_9BACL|nr:SMI1/KNR4 family protein [Paenibacillus ihbetae]ANY73772.1 cell wall assembly protein [Paenibacillus ihbetae]
MREELLEQLEEWHEEDEFEAIVDAITEIPEEERDYVLTSHLGRALNNLERYEEAVEQFLSIAEEGQEDPLWHYRIGLAYYYLEQYDNAREAFEAADRLEPGDEDTLEFLEWIRGKTEEQEEEAAVSAVEAPTGQASIPADTDVTDFWDDGAEAADSFIMAPPTDDLVESIEEELVFKLPAAYIRMMKVHNGGIPRRRYFPVTSGDATEGRIEIAGVLGIGREKRLSLCGEAGSRHMIESRGYPEIGVVLCVCPSEAEAVMLDYRAAGNDGEPEIVHVDQRHPDKITRLAPNFQAFVQGLVHE